MKNKLRKNYRQFLNLKKKKNSLRRFFEAFLPEVVYRTTKMENSDVSRKDIFSFMR